MVASDEVREVNRLIRRTRSSWTAMIRRCYDPRAARYEFYGGKGITVCDTWREDFEWFLCDMGYRPDGKFTIERAENSLGYFKENCRWATYGEQARNTSRNRWLTHQGETLCLADWAGRVGLNIASLHQRLDKGMSVEQALTMPARRQRNNVRAT